MKLYPSLACLLGASLLAPLLRPAVSAQLNLAPRPGGTEMDLTWPDLGSNKVYTLQHLDDLGQTRWVPLFPWAQWPVAETNHTDSIDGALARFYRLAVTERGRVTAVTFQENISAFFLNFFVIPTIESTYGIDIPFTAQYGVDIYRVDYETLDPLLGPTTASGALCIPVGIATAAPILSYHHGTIHRRDEAPSYPGVQERYVGQIMASHGFVVAMSDYLSLGTGSTGLHPYVHARSSATAVIDMLRATRAAVTNHPSIRPDVPAGLNGKIFLFGYSQGGYVTLATQKEIQERHSGEFTVTASAPSEGPYDLSGTMADAITSGQPYPSPNYLPYVLLSYNTIYPLFEDATEVMIDPYAQTIPPLFDGNHTGDEIDAMMPPSMVPSDILQPDFLAAFLNDPNHPFRAVLRENDLLNWAPTVPTRLYHCGADTTVPAANASVAYASFIAAGADPDLVQVVDPDPMGDHGDCLFSAVPLIISWFDSLR